MIHLYAFVHGLRSLPSTRGVAGEPLCLESIDGVDVVVGEVDEPVAVTRMNAVGHGLVVEPLVACADGVLPARLGEAFADRAALCAAIAPEVTRIRQALLRVRGCVEFAVRIEPGDVDRSDGASYLRGLARTDASLAAAHSALAAHAVASRVERSGRLFRGAYLVRRADAEDFARTAGGFATCSGPWAPYSFVGEPA